MLFWNILVWIDISDRIDLCFGLGLPFLLLDLPPPPEPNPSWIMVIQSTNRTWTRPASKGFHFCSSFIFRVGFGFKPNHKWVGFGTLLNPEFRPESWPIGILVCRDVHSWPFHICLDSCWSGIDKWPGPINLIYALDLDTNTKIRTESTQAENWTQILIRT